MHSLIDPAARIGPVSLTVADLARSRAYYTERIGLRTLSAGDGRLELGAGERTLLVLVEQPGARPVRNTTGLYHFALLVPSRAQLARTLRHLIDTETPIDGASDHLVSEALYLSDPDGHGIEIYRDRPRDEWRYVDDALEMTVDPFDMAGVLAEMGSAAPSYAGLSPETVMGHVHLHVADLAAAERFYVDVLGFSLTVRYGQAASFVAAGGYHHHVGLNVWAGAGAPPPPADAVQLRWATLVLADVHAHAEILARLADHGVSTTQRNGATFFRDPAANPWRLVVQEQP